MRALCGAIITAGAVIGLGLTALGIGTRYSVDNAPASANVDANGRRVAEPYLVKMSSMDRPLVFCLVLQTCMALVGLGIAILGLAYHHHRRHHEIFGSTHHATHPPGSTGFTASSTPPPM